MMRATSAACIAWPARSAITCPSSGRRQQREVADQIERLVPATFVGRAHALGIQHSLAVKQTAFSRDAPRISPIFRIWSRSTSHPNVRAKAMPFA